MTIFVLDTNVISDIVNPKANLNVLANLAANRQQVICLCEAVDYEIRRGYMRKAATTRLDAYEKLIKPQFEWTPLEYNDWVQASHYWADAVNRGKQLSDIDLLIAALATRLDAVIVSADTDFDVLPIKREDWRR